MSGSSSPSPLVADLREVVGESLRSVTEYERQDHEMLFVRADVDERYTQTEVDEVIDDLVLRGFYRAPLEGMFNAGDPECTLLKFEDALVFHVIYPDEAQGLFVSVDTGHEVVPGAVAETCHAHT